MSSHKKSEAVIWGSGKIGRGFLAEIFQDAGYHLSFIDCAQELIDKLNDASQYSIYKIKGRNDIERIRISGFDALHSECIDDIRDRFMNEDVIAAIAVHPAALPDTVRTLAPILMEKAKEQPDSSVNIILCINMTRPSDYVRNLFIGEWQGQSMDYLVHNIGLVESVVMRVSPETPAEYLKEDALAVINNGYSEMPVDAKAFKGSVPQTRMLRFSQNIHAEEVRKIYTLNMAHVMLAYLGIPKGYSNASEAIGDEHIRSVVEGALEEAAVGLSAEYGFSKADMDIWNQEIIASLDNPALGDQLSRLGADSQRKLGRNDRLVGPAILSLHAGRMPFYLAQGIAAGLKFSQPRDPGTQRVQDSIADKGLERTLQEVCQLKEQELMDLIITSCSK